MKNFLPVVICCIALLTISCAKTNGPTANVSPEASLQTKSLRDEYRLSEYTAFNWRNVFFYDADGFVDSIQYSTRAVSFTYRVKHRYNRIEAVDQYLNGRVIAAHYNYVYDLRGRLSRFTYENYDFGDPPLVTKITYDNYNNIQTIVKGAPEDFEYYYDSVVCDPQGVLASRHSIVYYPPVITASYTNDVHPNPLTMVENLQFMLIDQSYLQEQFLSSRNITSKMYEEDGFRVYYENTYDSLQRLVKVKFQDRFEPRPDSLVFKYVR